MPDDQQLSGSDGGSGGSVSDAERMGEESEVGHETVSLLYFIFGFTSFQVIFQFCFILYFFKKTQFRCCQRHIENGLFVHIIQQEKQLK